MPYFRCSGTHSTRLMFPEMVSGQQIVSYLVYGNVDPSMSIGEDTRCAMQEERVAFHFHKTSYELLRVATS